MKPLTPEDLLQLDEYERQREGYRSRIIALKQRRRVSLGPLITLVFENRETLRFQIQEMIRAERILESAKVKDELDVYNELLPASNELEIVRAMRLYSVLEGGSARLIAEFARPASLRGLAALPLLG